MARRPEHRAPPEIFYDEKEARKYTRNTRTMEIQTAMAERCIELLALPEGRSCLVLDVGCGSGLSGDALEEAGHRWIGVDISSAMLDVAREREPGGDLLLGDAGAGLPFRAGSFDGAVSVSVLQWLCVADSSGRSGARRAYAFFSSLFACLTRFARAALQFYPENAAQAEMLASQATRAGFHGGVLVDYPNSTKAKKFYLVLTTGGPAPPPRALGADDATSTGVEFGARVKSGRVDRRKKTREWILEKKARRRRQGRETRPDTKYTGRRRSGRF